MKMIRSPNPPETTDHPRPSLLQIAEMPYRSPFRSLAFVLLLLSCFLPHLLSSDECLELTRPLPSDLFTPSCSLLLLQQDFANSVGSPPATTFYSPPSHCPGPWSHVVLELHASCQGKQRSRIAGVWMAGVEILRTSTAEPTESGTFWKVRKDVSRYSSLLVRSGVTLTVMLENDITDVFTGVYHVDVSLLYYGGSRPRVSSTLPNRVFNRKMGVLTEKTVNWNNEKGIPAFKDDEFAVTTTKNAEDELGFRSQVRKLGLISNEPGGRRLGQEELGLTKEKPADLIIPISDDGDEGFWFRIQSESDERSKKFRIPRNAYRAVLEIYVSFHGNDEFWYSNPPKSSITLNNSTTGVGNETFRQVFAMIDGVFVGSVVPFPVISTGGINPLFWEPFVPIGAFNLPSYDIDLTPFLGLVLDGKKHSFVLGVTGSNPFWLVDANLHIWLDPKSSVVQAESGVYQFPPLSVRRESTLENFHGSFHLTVKGKAQFSGWVHSEASNFTTHVSQEFKFMNSIRFKKNGEFKEVRQMFSTKRDVKVHSHTGALVIRTTFKRRCPLRIITQTLPGSDSNSSLLFSNVSHALNEKYVNGVFESILSNTQDSGGWMVIQDHTVLSGSTETRQTLSYVDGFSSYTQTVAASNGEPLI